MLFALLFNEQDQLLAATPAVFQYAMGDSYWRDIYAADVGWNADFQTAYVEVIDDPLIDMLNSLETDDQHLAECRCRINRLIGLSGDSRQPRAA